MKTRLMWMCALVVVLGGFAGVRGQEAKPGGVEYVTVKDVSYVGEMERDEYRRERCRLDVYYPKGLKGFGTMVWFHGGGLTGGGKSIPKGLQEKGFAVVAVNYRLSPRAKSPAYVEDAAEAVAWTFRNIEKYGGSKEKIFVGGVSAGGYLASMIGLDGRWLGRHGLEAGAIAGLLPVSGQAITHYTIREERGIKQTQPVVDEMAPLFHVRGDAPPMLIVTGDRELEMVGRYEENAYLARMMKLAGHERTKLYELDGFNHGQIGEAALPLVVQFAREVLKEREKAGK